MKKQRKTNTLTLTPRETGLGWLYLAAEFLLLPGLIYELGSFAGGFSDAAANFLYYLCNALFCTAIFRNLLHQSLLQAGRRWKELLGSVLVGFLVCQAAIKLMALVLARLAPAFSNVNDRAVLELMAQNSLLMLLGTVLLVPIAEECLFRGLLFLPFYRKNHGLGYLISALAFSAVHVVGYVGAFPPATLVLCFVQYLPAGLVLAWACARSGSLFAPMLIHSAINAVSFLSLR